MLEKYLTFLVCPFTRSAHVDRIFSRIRGVSKANLPDYGSRKQKSLQNYSAFIQQAIKKNKKTKEGFELEWGLSNYEDDKTWELIGGDLLKLRVWLYHPGKDLVHNTFNFLRTYTPKLPINVQYYLNMFTLFPPGYVVKENKG